VTDVVHELRRQPGRAVGRVLLWLVDVDVAYDRRGRELWVRVHRRRLVDVVAGEIVDEVWLDELGRVRSFSKSKGRTDPPAAGVRAASPRGSRPPTGSGSHPQDPRPPAAGPESPQLARRPGPGRRWTELPPEQLAAA
jgi:hypothetical protein